MQYQREIIAWVVIFVITVPIFIGCTIFFARETSHYHYPKCRIIDCNITSTRICTHSTINYRCYDGNYNYYPLDLDENYTKHNTFVSAEEDFYYTCLGSATIFCTYDDRDVVSSLSTGYQPDWYGIVVVIILCIILIATQILFAIIMGSIWLCHYCEYK